MADQTDTPVENEEATNNTLEASVDEEQPSRKSKGSSKTTDKRRRMTSSSADSASGNESSDSDSNGEGDSSNSSSSEANPKRKKSASSPKHVGDADYRRFDTGAQARTKLELTNDMHKYLNEKFKIYVKDKAIQESVLDSNPVPDAESLKIPKVDGYLNEIFDTLGKSYGRESDGTLSKTQARINNVMGPLGKLWLNLEKVRTDDSTDELDLFDCLKLVEQSVTLLGQANVSLTYARRLSILGRLTGDMKKAKKLLSKHESSLSSSHKNLFGKRFYKALSKATKIRKSTKDISQHLAGFSKPSRPSAYKGPPLRRDSYRGRGPRDSHQPFRGMPSSHGRGGGRTVSFKPRPPSRPFNKGKSVRFRFKRRSPDAQSPIAGSTLPGGINSVCSSSSTVHGAEHHPCKPKPPSGGAAATFSEQLEITDTGSVHFENDQGGTDSLCRTPKAGTGPLSDLSQPAGKACDRTGNCRNVAERGDSGGLPPERGIYKYSFLSQKERWGEQTCNQLKTVEQFCCLSTFQNGGAALAKAFSPEGRLDDKNRSEGCLLYCANRSRAPAAPSFYLWGHEVPVYMPSIWLGTSPPSIHQAFKACCSSSSKTGSENDYLFRRYHYIQSDSGRYFEGQGLHSVAASEFRLYYKLEEISFTPSPVHGVPRFSDQFIGDETIFATGENDPTYSDLQRFNSGEKSLSENSLSDYWETDLIYTGSFSGTPPLPAFAKAPSKGFVDGQGVRDSCPSERGLSGRPSVVDRPNVQLEWSLDNHTSPRLDNNDGCVAEGLGAVCQGRHTRGLWTQEESSSLHINALELKAALFAVRAFTPNRRQLHVHLRMDNRTAVAYLLRMGGTRSPALLSIAQELWEYALNKQITLTAEYLPGELNHEADWESRHFRDSSNWKLNPTVFQALDHLWGPLTIDLFADRMNTQLQSYISWFPDPFAHGTDAFQIPWTNLRGYSFPPFSMICRCLAKIRKDQATIVLITPTWHTQAWYPVLLEMSCRQPILLPPLSNLLLSPNLQPHPLVLQGHLSLAAWMVTGKTCLQTEFQSKLPNFSAPTLGEQARQELTTAPGNSGVAGVVRGKLIHFAPLWPL